jgi:hypothetical protein
MVTVELSLEGLRRVTLYPGPRTVRHREKRQDENEGKGTRQRVTLFGTGPRATVRVVHAVRPDSVLNLPNSIRTFIPIERRPCDIQGGNERQGYGGDEAQDEGHEEDDGAWDAE